jgi:hypothetical protein
MSEVEVREKQSSIEVSRNAKGDYAFKVKLYFNEEETAGKLINDRIQHIMIDLKERFK